MKKIDLLLLSVIGLLFCYVYSFLRFDSWDVSIIDFLGWFENDWAINPKDWTGIHKIIDAIPIYFVPIILFIYIIMSWLSNLPSNEDDTPTAVKTSDEN